MEASVGNYSMSDNKFGQGISGSNKPKWTKGCVQVTLGPQIYHIKTEGNLWKLHLNLPTQNLFFVPGFKMYVSCANKLTMNICAF